MVMIQRVVAFPFCLPTVNTKTEIQEKRIGFPIWRKYYRFLGRGTSMV